ncbi:MAG: guanine nucleotide-binding protein (G protein) subunit alpha [Amphiamblys sp. WSBS2006]|nr:MAG: guanine nucleotide-binding protein (G protein) subunit alpha [Amphiamblys sp. WSBS2006]
MGICQSKPKEGESAASKDIDKILKEEQKEMEKEIKLLLLGAGESGKSTILKQMKMIHQAGYSDQEREEQRAVIFGNVAHSARALCHAMETLDIGYGSDEGEAAGRRILELPEEISTLPSFDADLADAVKAVWGDSGVQEAYKRRTEYQLNDSCKYYLDDIDRLTAPGYLPTDQDILRARVKTTGIIETIFDIKGRMFKMYDVGGQRSERKKWIHCFENVTAIVFLVAISEYDQKLVEDEAVNRMEEALSLFDSICNSRWFAKTPIVLFLNKIDVFEDKILYAPIEDYFSDYDGGADFDSAKEYFKNKFTALNNNEKRDIYTHYTCATDTTQVKNIMNSVQDTIVKRGIASAGLA